MHRSISGPEQNSLHDLASSDLLDCIIDVLRLELLLQFLDWQLST